MNRPKSKKKGQITTREELIFALSWAAEIEHGLTCIYLFAAFSIKRFLGEGIDELQQNQLRNWQGTTLAVAMQEMEHLGYVCNMLNAIGGAQHFDRPNLPQPASYYSTEGSFTMERFNVETIKRFMEFEKPAPTSDAEGEVLGTGLVPDIIQVFDHHTVQDLYNSILQGFKNLDKQLGDDLFIGPEAAQLEDSDIVVGYANHEYGIDLEKVVDLKSAIKAIDIIVEQGEGIILTPPGKSKNKGIPHLYQEIVGYVSDLKNLEFNSKSSGKLLISISNSLVKTLIHACRMLKDKEMETLLSRYIYEIEKNIDTAKNNLTQPRKLRTIRNKIVDITVYDTEGILLSAFTEKNSHYMRFWKMYQEMKNIKYQPSRNVVPNPALRVHADNAGQKINLITHPYTFQTLEIFNASYEVMVQMLILIFSFSGISNKERTLLVNTAFFPLMTMVIRPLSEILTMLPAYSDKKGFDAPRAGPAFEYYLNIGLLPHRQPGWEYLNERLHQISGAVIDLKMPRTMNQYLQPPLIKIVEKQVKTLQGNLSRVAENFKIGFNLK